jgi:hypothetical protein
VERLPEAEWVAVVFFALEELVFCGFVLDFEVADFFALEASAELWVADAIGTMAHARTSAQIALTPAFGFLRRTTSIFPAPTRSSRTHENRKPNGSWLCNHLRS